MQTVARETDHGKTEPSALVVEHSSERDRVVERAVAAVVELESPAREVRSRGTRDLDRFAGVGSGVVVVKLVDEDRALRRRRGRNEETCDRAERRQAEADRGVGHG